MFLIFCFLLLITNTAIAQENTRLDVINQQIERLEKQKEKLLEFQSRTEKIETEKMYVPERETQERKDMTTQIEIIDQKLERLKTQRDVSNIPRL